jgi:vacuolar-type H+-ATPase subunit E/Vma4
LECLGEHGIRKGFKMNVNYPNFVGAPLPDDKQLFDAIRGSEMARKLLAERNKHVFDFRKTAAEKLAKIDAAAEISFPKLRAAREATIAKATAAEIEWRKACDVAQQAQRDLSSASHMHSTELQKLEAQLIETASPEIAIFISDMRDEMEKSYKRFAFHTSTETVSRITGKKDTVTINNRASVTARQTAIRDAQAAAEAMRLEPDQSTVSARLQELRNNLPAIAGL